MKFKCGDLENNLINPFSYWVTSGKIAAGEYPGRQFVLSPKALSATIIHTMRALWVSRFKFWNTSGFKIGSLLDNGITVFIDLTEEGERPSYLESLHRQRRKRGIRTKYHRFPIKDRSVPDIDSIKSLFEMVKTELTGGSAIYIHCFRGLGRTGLVVGCYLKELEKPDMDVIECLNMLRNGVAADFRNSPETEEQIQFARDWIVGSMN